MSLEAVVTCNNNINKWKNRFSSTLSVPELKKRLELITGATSNMKVFITDEAGNIHADITNEISTLNKICKPKEVLLLKVIDDTIHNNEFDDLSEVEKFELSEQEYSSRSNTVRNFLASKGITTHSQDATKIDNLDGLHLDNRCKISMNGQPTKIGTIKYLGLTKFKEGNWVGIKCDLPLGKNDGSVDGVKYFDCLPKYGIFVRPKFVEVGDFPEDDDDLEL